MKSVVYSRGGDFILNNSYLARMYVEIVNWRSRKAKPPTAANQLARAPVAATLTGIGLKK